MEKTSLVKWLTDFLTIFDVLCDLLLQRPATKWNLFFAHNNVDFCVTGTLLYLLWLVSSAGRALHRYRRGHRFKSRTGPNFIQALFSPLLKQCSLLPRSLSYKFFDPQFTHMFSHILCFFFKRNLLYKNVEAEINQNFKNVLITFLRLRVD